MYCVKQSTAVNWGSKNFVYIKYICFAWTCFKQILSPIRQLVRKILGEPWGLLPTMPVSPRTSTAYIQLLPTCLVPQESIDTSINPKYPDVIFDMLTDFEFRGVSKAFFALTFGLGQVHGVAVGVMVDFVEPWTCSAVFNVSVSWDSCGTIFISAFQSGVIWFSSLDVMDAKSKFGCAYRGDEVESITSGAPCLQVSELLRQVIRDGTRNRSS